MANTNKVQEFNAKIEHFLGDKKIGKPVWPIYYGIELEWEIKLKDKNIQKWLNDHYCDDDEMAQAIDAGEPGHRKISPLMNHICQILYPKTKEFAFMKRDGSLDQGIELVSVPMTMDAHQESWEEVLSLAKNNGLECKQNCGMHVHASKEVLSPLQIGKIVYFMHNANNRGFLNHMAGREIPAKYANIHNSKKISDVNRHSHAGDPKNRYDGINTTGYNTIEFRIFLSTLDYKRLMANLQFCAALISFAWPGNSSVKEFNLENFFKFLSATSKRKEFPFIYNFLKETGYIIDDRKHKMKPEKPEVKQEIKKKESLVELMVKKPVKVVAKSKKKKITFGYDGAFAGANGLY